VGVKTLKDGNIKGGEGNYALVPRAEPNCDYKNITDLDAFKRVL